MTMDHQYVETQGSLARTHTAAWPERNTIALHADQQAKKTGDGNRVLSDRTFV